MADSIYIKRLDSTDSTNRYARDEAESLWRERGNNDFAVVTAGHQTSGRGQRGNTWHSQPGKNLLFSILVRPGQTLEASKQFVLSQAVALTIHDVMGYYGIEVQLKWPNDIYAGKRKLAGILLELDYSGAFVEQAIIGIGINVNQDTFPPMDKVPVSMKMLKKAESRKQKAENRKQEDEYIIDDVLATILDRFEHYYNELRFGNRDAIAAKYDERLLGINARHTFIDKNGKFEAIIKGVESDGHLLLQRNDGSVDRYAFKEVEMEL